MHGPGDLEIGFHEKLMRLIDRVVVGPNGFFAHHKGGGVSFTVRSSGTAAVPL